MEITVRMPWNSNDFIHSWPIARHGVKDVCFMQKCQRRMEMKENLWHLTNYFILNKVHDLNILSRR